MSHILNPLSKMHTVSLQPYSNESLTSFYSHLEQPVYTLDTYTFVSHAYHRQLLQHCLSISVDIHILNGTFFILISRSPHIGKAYARMKSEE